MNLTTGQASETGRSNNLRTFSTTIALEAAERGVPRRTSFRRHRLYP